MNFNGHDCPQSPTKIPTHFLGVLKWVPFGLYMLCFGSDRNSFKRAPERVSQNQATYLRFSPIGGVDCCFGGVPLPSARTRASNPQATNPNRYLTYKKRRSGLSDPALQTGHGGQQGTGDMRGRQNWAAVPRWFKIGDPKKGFIWASINLGSVT